MPRDVIWDNPVLGTVTHYDYDEAGDTVILETVQDVEPIVERNKQSLNDNAGRRFGDGKIVASIPMIMLMQLVQRGILSPQFAVLDEKRFRAWLNDPENRHFRTFGGTI